MDTLYIVVPHCARNIPTGTDCLHYVRDFDCLHSSRDLRRPVLWNRTTSTFTGAISGDPCLFRQQAASSVIRLRKYPSMQSKLLKNSLASLDCLEQLDCFRKSCQ